MLDELRDGLTGHGIGLTWDDTVLDYLTEKSYSVQYGARNLRRTIEKDIENPIAETIIDSYQTPIRTIAIAARDGKLSFDAR